MSQESDTEAAAPVSGIPFADLRKTCRGMSAAEFEERWGSAFLVLSHGDLAVPDGPGSTVVEVQTSDDAGHSSGTGGASLVYPVRRSGRSLGHFVSAGRTSNNDVVISDSSVSRFHAFFKQGEDGRFCVQDAGSTNGTAVNGQKAPVRGEGDAVELKSDDIVLIGQVGLRFLEAEQLHELLAGAG